MVAAHALAKPKEAEGLSTLGQVETLRSDLNPLRNLPVLSSSLPERSDDMTDGTPAALCGAPAFATYSASRVSRRSPSCESRRTIRNKSQISGNALAQSGKKGRAVSPCEPYSLRARADTR